MLVRLCIRFPKVSPRTNNQQNNRTNNRTNKARHVYKGAVMATKLQARKTANKPDIMGLKTTIYAVAAGVVLGCLIVIVVALW